jgi:Flp pilus assembly protein CpaB
MNTIRPQTVTLAAVAIMFGLVTAWGAKTILTPKPVVPTVEKPKMASVVVAQGNLTEYLRIADRDVADVEVRPDEVPPGAVPVKQRAFGRLVKGTIVAGHVVREEDLYPLGTLPKMADQLPPGYRAVVVRVEDERVEGTMAPYWDPDCDCRAQTLFEGTISGNRITGSFSTRRESSDRRILTGKWEAERS